MWGGWALLVFHEFSSNKLIKSPPPEKQMVATKCRSRSRLWKMHGVCTFQERDWSTQSQQVVYIYSIFNHKMDTFQISCTKNNSLVNDYLEYSRFILVSCTVHLLPWCINMWQVFHYTSFMSCRICVSSLCAFVIVSSVLHSLFPLFRDLCIKTFLVLLC